MMPKLILTLALLATFPATANELRGVYKNNQGVKKFERDKGVEAMDDFTSALADRPFGGELHYNLGNTFLKNKEVEKALSEYNLALKLSQGEGAREKQIRFLALFNSAVAASMNKQTDQALELYQQALELQPDSIETKTNIELLTAGGSGEGEGDKDSEQKGKDGKKDKKDDKGKDDKNPGDKPFENPRSTPKPYGKDRDVSEQDAKRIFEELKRQEEQIRARMQQGPQAPGKDSAPEKDW